jgi:hypothetical protein
MKIRLGESDQAFAKGVVAGDKAMARLDESAKDAGFPERFGFFWLQVGAYMATELPDDGGQELQMLYLRGAALRAPEAALILVVDRAESQAFAPDADTDEQARYEMALILYRTARAIEHDEMEEGTLLDSNKVKVGTFKLHLDGG